MLRELLAAPGVALAWHDCSVEVGRGLTVGQVHRTSLDRNSLYDFSQAPWIVFHCVASAEF